MPRHVDPATKTRAVEMVADGKDPAEVAGALGISRSAVCQYCREAGVKWQPRKSPVVVAWTRGSRIDQLPEAIEAWRERVQRASVDDVAERVLRSSWEADAST